MIIGVAGPYSAADEKERAANLDALNSAAARLLEMGHIPLIGINVALPIVRQSKRGRPLQGAHGYIYNGNR